MEYEYFRKASYSRNFKLNDASEKTAISLMYGFLDALGSPHGGVPSKVGERAVNPETEKEVVPVVNTIEKINVREYNGLSVGVSPDGDNYKIEIYAHPGSEAWIKLDSLEPVLKAYLDIF